MACSLWNVPWLAATHRLAREALDENAGVLLDVDVLDSVLVAAANSRSAHRTHGTGALGTAQQVHRDVAKHARREAS